MDTTSKANPEKNTTNVIAPEKPYQEEEGSSFVHDGQIYDLNKLLLMAVSIKEHWFRVDDLVWVLAYDQAVDPERVSRADLDVAVLIAMTNTAALATVDGLHRLTRASMLKRERILGRYIPAEVLAMCRLPMT